MTQKAQQFSLEKLNEAYGKKTVYQRVENLYVDFEAKDIMLTSAFAATSAFLLKVFSDVNKDQVIYFIDTGYHFPETLIYKEYLTKLYDLKVVEIRAGQEKHQQTKDEQLWEKDPNKCCFINKVEPLDHIKKDFKVWVSGLMKWQSNFRASLDYFEQREEILKFYPLLDIGFIERDEFIREHHLPFHPLKSKGYNSIGCHHCTVPGSDRSGRWNNSPKTECGLHL
ncbi:MAG: phosphoadenylyl-sulfate reductase [Saprospiraceae bacterium]|nr:phosphoadenylyl-sulfate reductase [Saprospiraceae bacterium]